jgi:hypothetical protein
MGKMDAVNFDPHSPEQVTAACGFCDALTKRL